MQLTVNQIEAANVQQVSAPKAGAIKQAFDSLLKEIFTPGWKKWKRKLYAMLLIDNSLRKGVESHFPLLLAETEEEKIEKFLLKEFQKWQFHDKLSIRTRELLGEILNEEELEDAHKIARNSWWEYIDKTRTSEMTTQEISTLALAKSGNNSKKALEVAANIQKTHVEQVEIPQTFENNILETMKGIIDGIEASLLIEETEAAPAVEVFETEIEVAVETQSTDEGVAKGTKQAKKTPTKTTANKKPKNRTQIVQLTIKELKAYAKERKIAIPGSVTDIREQRKIVIKAQNGVTKILPVKS